MTRLCLDTMDKRRLHAGADHLDACGYSEAAQSVRALAPNTHPGVWARAFGELRAVPGSVVRDAGLTVERARAIPSVADARGQRKDRSRHD